MSEENLPDIGLKLEKLPRQLELVRVLEYFEIDILSEYRVSNGPGVYLQKWCGTDRKKQRYLIVRSENRSIAEYLGFRISMLTLLTESSDGNGFLVDKVGNEIVGVFSVRLNELPKKYLPDEDAFHDLDFRPHWDIIPQNFLFSGDWDARMLADVERKFLDICGFSYFTEPNTNRKLPNKLLNYDYDGGYVIMHAYKGIRKHVPASARPKSASVSAASPGVLTINSPASVFAHLSESITLTKFAKNDYKQIHTWSKLPTKDVDKIPSTAFDDLKDFCEKINVDINALFPNPTKKTPKPQEIPLLILAAAKLVASHYRRLKKIRFPEKGVEYIFKK